MNENVIDNNSKKRIISVAAELFSELGFKGVSMAAIAKKLNFTKPALYYHFKNKKELYFAAIDNAFKKFVFELNKITENGKEAPGEKLIDISRNYLRFGLQEKNFTRLLFQNSFVKKDRIIVKYFVKLRKKIIEKFEKIIKEFHKEKKIFEKNKTKADTSLLVGTIDGLLINKNFFQKKVTKKEMDNQIKRVISLISKVDE